MVTTELMEMKLKHLEEAIKDIAPKVNDAMTLYHTLRNKHGSLVKEHRELQRDIRVRRGDVKVVPMSASKYTKKKESAIDIKSVVNCMTDEQKADLARQLLGE